MLFRWLNFLLNYSNYPRAYMIMRWLIPAIIRLSGPRVGYLPLKCLVLQYWIYGRYRPFNVWKLSCKIWSDNLCNKWAELPKFKQTRVITCFKNWSAEFFSIRKTKIPKLRLRIKSEIKHKWSKKTSNWNKAR